MATETKKAKAQKTPRQLEIEQLRKISSAKRTEQQQARLDQLNAEEKRDRFERLAAKRVNKCLLYISHVARLGNRNVYTCKPEEAAKIIAAVSEATKSLVSAFSEKGEQKQKFTF